MTETFSRREALSILASVVLPLASPGCSRDTLTSRDATSELPLHYLSLAAVAKRLASGDLTSTALTRHMLDRTAAVDGRLKSYVTVMADRAIANAEHADAQIRAGGYRGPLHGVPVGVKDLCDTRGVRTMAGSKVLADFIPDTDSTVVERLEAAGAVVLGKLALCEGAFSPYYPGFPVPVNPWDAARWSGVSSSGSGVATAAGLCFAAVSTDTGGSIRYPSAANGCVGLKPTYGRVSRHGVFALAASLDHVGPMARTVEDASLMFEAMAGSDPRDPTSLADVVQQIVPQLSRGVAGLRIGFDRRYATTDVDADVAEAINSVISELNRLGATSVPVTVPDVSPIASAWFEICAAEMAIAHAKTFPSRAGDYGPGVRPVLEYGRRVTRASLAAASKVRSAFSASLEQLLISVDCLVCPSMGNAARPRLTDPYGEETDASWARLVGKDVHTKLFNFSGSPTLSVPCGFSTDGLPLSVQFVGRRLTEAMLCRVGHAYEQSTEWHERHPQL